MKIFPPPTNCICSCRYLRYLAFLPNIVLNSLGAAISYRVHEPNHAALGSGLPVVFKLPSRGDISQPDAASGRPVWEVLLICCQLSMNLVRRDVRRQHLAWARASWVCPASSYHRFETASAAPRPVWSLWSRATRIQYLRAA